MPTGVGRERKPVKAIGIQQMRILEPMGRNAGMWPPAWRLNYRDLKLMERLEERGLVRKLERDITALDLPVRWILTDLGREVLRRKTTRASVPNIQPKIDRRRKEWRNQDVRR